MTMPENLRRGTLLLILFLVMSSYAVIVSLAGSRAAIELLNVVMLSLASAVAVAYGSVVWKELRGALLDRAAVLSIGIFTAWLSVFYRTGSSIIWRIADKPIEWLDSGLWGAHIPLSCFALICHLIAPEVLGGRVPTKAAVKIGCVIALGVFAGAGIAVINID